MTAQGRQRRRQLPLPPNVWCDLQTLPLPCAHHFDGRLGEGRPVGQGPQYLTLPQLGQRVLQGGAIGGLQRMRAMVWIAAQGCTAGQPPTSGHCCCRAAASTASQ